MNKIFFKSTDGTKLCGVWHLPKAPTNKAIILAHGITADKDESGVFIDLAELLKDNGFAVFRFDFRGSGESGGKSVDLTIQGEIVDITAAINKVKSSGYTQIGLLGASFGGGASILYSSKQQEQIKCLCLWNPVLNYDHCFLHATTDWVKDKVGHMRQDFEEKGWTTLGSAKFVIGKQLFAEMENLFPYKELKKITIPIVILHGTKDKHVPYEDSKEYIKGNGEFVTIVGASHGFHEKGRIQNEAFNNTLEFFRKNLT